MTPHAGGGPRIEDLWLAALRASGRSPRTLETYRAAMDTFLAWRHDPEMATVTRADAYAYLSHLTEHYKPAGVALRIRALRAMYSWAGREEIHSSNPFVRLGITVPSEARTTASEAQIEEMLARAKGSSRDIALLTLLIDTGCRKGEIAALQCHDIDLESGVVRYPVSKSMPRTVPLTDRAVVALGRWLRERGSGPGSVWSVDDPYALVRNCVKRCSQGQLSPHALRRAFAVRALRNGVSESSLQRLCGWTGSSMIQTYVRAQADQLAHEQFRRLMTAAKRQSLA